MEYLAICSDCTTSPLRSVDSITNQCVVFREEYFRNGLCVYGTLFIYPTCDTAYRVLCVLVAANNRRVAVGVNETAEM
jgi:hypothetical protein